LKRKILEALVAILSTTLRLIDAIGSSLAMRITPRTLHIHGTSGSGISVIIPERGNPAMLQECLESVSEAARHISEPFETIVVVNGSSPAAYEDLDTLHPSVHWMFFRRRLWFNGAVRKGLKAAKYDWVYLLNSDMTVDPLAFAELLPWRAPHIFALASQIVFKDPLRRREETGWTQFGDADGLPEIYDAMPEDDRVRGTFYVGGGASMFQKSLLRRFSRGSHVYAPFYWEDVEWSTVAWRCGFESLFCPKSMARHYHRATNRLFFSETEIDRIFQRNRIQYELRNRLLWPKSELQFISRFSRELMKPLNVAGILLARLKYWTYPFRELPLQYTWRSYYVKPWTKAADKPTVLIVTPYCIYPPVHGGAVRLHRLVRSIAEEFNVVLLSDEAEGYTSSALQYFEPLTSVHFISGRPKEAGNGRAQRIMSHSHTGLKAALAMLAASRHPALVQVEFTELAGLIDVRRDSIQWLLTMHEVWLPKRTEDATPDDLYEAALAKRFDAIIACSEEDAALVDHVSVHVVHNGADIPSTPYTPSPECGPVLFVGPFRYLPNLQGIQEFLEKVYPVLSKSIPNFRLWILGGYGATLVASQIPCFSQSGVTVINYAEQVEPILEQCSMTINPLNGVRGSCLKIAESFAAGRACVSTKEGARGFLRSRIRSLTIVESIAEFEDPIRRLYGDIVYRHACESPPSVTMNDYSWDSSSRRLLEIYRSIINAAGSGERGSSERMLPERPRSPEI
jgi:GT2 family glycosyltransferase